MNSDNQSIGELAYRLWQARGCPEGTAEQDWLEAERQLAGDKQPVAVATPTHEPLASREPSSIADTSLQSTSSLGDRSRRSRTLRAKPLVTDPSADRPS